MPEAPAETAAQQSPKTPKSPSKKTDGAGSVGATTTSGTLAKTSMVNIAAEDEYFEGTSDGCMAVEMWYWNTRNEFKSEVMFCNPIESETPKLIIPLDVFEKMKKVYSEKARILLFKQQEFDELLSLFRTVRRQYYADLQHLRELLKQAKEAADLRAAGGYQDPRKKAKIERMEACVANTEVRFFNVLDAIDPEFKTILIQECREFHRQLILENASLREQIAALGGGDLTLEQKML